AENYFGIDKEYGMKRGLWALAVGTALAAFGSGAMAGVSYDSSLASPGWYNGTGNPQGGFTVDNDNGVEVGLRAKLRQSNSVIDSPSNVYVVPGGPQSGSPTHAAWNYEFSINLSGAGFTLNDIATHTTLTITDLTNSASATVNPLTYWGDNSGYGTGGKDQPAVPSDFGVQNSENPAFGDFPLHGTYNDFAPDTYRFTLNVVDNAGVQLASDSIDVIVAPLPSSLLGALALLGGLGIVVTAKRLRRTAAI